MLSSKSIWMLAAATAFLASPAQAQDVTGTQQEPGTAPGTSVELNVPLATEAPRIVTVDPDATLSDNELGDLRGGEGIVVTNQTLVAITSGNVINGDYVVTSGSCDLEWNNWQAKVGAAACAGNAGIQRR